MTVDLSVRQRLHSRVQSWKATYLPTWLDAVYSGNTYREDQIEEALVELMRCVDLRVELLAQVSHKRGLFASLPAEEQDTFEDLVVDANLCLRDMVSLRPECCTCPVRKVLASSLKTLRNFAGFREYLWSP